MCPAGTRRWFDLFRSPDPGHPPFQDPSGWTPHYTDSGVDAGFQPLCFGASMAGR
jgi:1,2-dihydroxy-3-keto-5-methylthiopentene dioxygenase